jgi:pyruvate formate lyase activating enzyme
MYGCDLRCPYCHNFNISQALREGRDHEQPSDIAPDALVGEALRAGCAVLCSAYNEPMITAEWVHAVFGRARTAGLVTALISDGHSTPEALEYMRDVTDVFRVDLKGFDDGQYRTLGGRFEPVIDSIERAKALGYWVEVVTLVVPGFNQQMDGIAGLASRLAAIDPSIPWHLNAFMPRYKLTHRAPPEPLFMITAAGVALARGLRFVYVGNLAAAAELAHTRCPSCHDLVLERRDYELIEDHSKSGACARCGDAIPGIW